MIFNSKFKVNISQNIKFFLLIFIITAVTISWSTKENKDQKYVAYEKDSLASVQAFLKVYDVLQSPRCLNCHPKGDVPLQGEDSHLHAMLPKRGKDGKGIFAMKCTNCHQGKNTPGLHTPPGSPVWHLPPADMKMVFEDKSPFELAKQMLDPKQNGNKSHDELIEHVESDSLVLWGWNPGEGRALPPLSHDVFSEFFRTWIEKGAYIPDSNIPAAKKGAE